MTDVLDDETRTLSEELQEEVRTELDVFSPLTKMITTTFNPYRATVYMVFKAPCGMVTVLKENDNPDIPAEYERVPGEYYAQHTIENSQIIEWDKSSLMEPLSTAIAQRIYSELTMKAGTQELEMEQKDIDEITSFLTSRFPDLQTISEQKEA